MEQEFKDGDVVQILTDNSRGIVVGQSPKMVNVLFDSYIAVPILKTGVYKTGRHIDLNMLWDVVYKL